jgi:hypothetical protein
MPEMNGFDDRLKGEQIVPSRRDFLQSAAVLSASPLAGRAVFAADGRDLAALDAVVIDQRHADALSFGRRAADWGAPVRAIEGDITDLWQRELLARWQAAPAAVAGLTERPALFLLERLSWEHGLRVVYEAEHASSERGVAHNIVRTADARLERVLAEAGSAWPRILADTLLAGSGVASGDAGPSDAAMAAYLGEPTKLYSWIIAPRSAARSSRAGTGSRARSPL